MYYNLDVESKEDLLVLMLSFCVSLGEARVFMVSLARVLEIFKIVPNCDKLWYVNVLHFHHLYMKFLAYKT
jgi:hypothetical protein